MSTNESGCPSFCSMAEKKTPIDISTHKEKKRTTIDIPEEPFFLFFCFFLSVVMRLLLMMTDVPLIPENTGT